MANSVDTVGPLLRTWMVVLLTASVARAGEYCEYMKLDDNKFEHRISYCEGYCCDEHDRRCCVDHHYTALLIGIILAGGIFLAVVITVIVVLCKRANLKRARVRDQELATVYGGGDQNGRLPHYPHGGQGIFHIANLPSYSASNAQSKPPAYSGPIQSEKGQPGEGYTYPRQIRNGETYARSSWGGSLHQDPFRSGSNEPEPIRGGATNLPPIRGREIARREPRDEQGGAMGEATGDISNRDDQSSSAARYPWDSGNFNWDVSRINGGEHGTQGQRDNAKGKTGDNPNHVDLSSAKGVKGDNSNQTVNLADVNRDSSRYPAWDSGQYDLGNGHPDEPPPAYTYEDK